MKNLSKTIISIVLIIAIVSSIGIIYNAIQERCDEYIVIENKPNPEAMENRIIVLENCETKEIVTKEVLNRTINVIAYKEGKIVEMRK